MRHGQSTKPNDCDPPRDLAYPHGAAALDRRALVLLHLHRTSTQKPNPAGADYAAHCRATRFVATASPPIVGSIDLMKSLEGLVFFCYRANRLRRSELVTTSTELAAMAAPAIIGFSSPNAATGMPMAL